MFGESDKHLFSNRKLIFHDLHNKCNIILKNNHIDIDL